MSLAAFTNLSQPIIISGRVTEDAPGVMKEDTVNLQLDVLNQEVFLVYAVDLNPGAPENIDATTTEVNASLSTTSRSTIGFIADSNVIATADKAIIGDGVAPGGNVFVGSTSLDSPPGPAIAYIGIISTNNFFVQVVGRNNNNVKSSSYRMWGARARVKDASVYAALVQSELLSE